MWGELRAASTCPHPSVPPPHAATRKAFDMIPFGDTPPPHALKAAPADPVQSAPDKRMARQDSALPDPLVPNPRGSEPAPQRLGPIQTGPHTNTNRTDFIRMVDADAPDYAIIMSQADVDAVMDAVGYDVILEEIARGNLRNTLALRYHVPIIKFHKWLDSRVQDKAMVEMADRLCAQSMVVKSHMVLQQDAPDGTQAGMMKAFSKRMSEVAEAIAPKDWLPDKDAHATPVGTTAIQINIGGNAVIPGTEVLAAPVPVIEHKETTDA